MMPGYFPPLTKAERKRVQAEMDASLMRAGAAAFWAGLPITKCPDFKFDDMAWAWRQGWRNARDEANK